MGNFQGLVPKRGVNITHVFWPVDDSTLELLCIMKINPKNFFGRKVKEVPIGWSSTIIDMKSDYQESKISNWIYKNCNGRFCILTDVHHDRHKVKQITKIAFENSSDLTLFHLSGKAQEY